MTTTYQNRGIQFLYPENWTLSENKTDVVTQVSLESPQGCIWDFYRMPESRYASAWLDQWMATMSEQYDSFEQTPLEIRIGEYPVSGFEAFFYCLDLLITAHVLELPMEAGERRFLMYQGESREFDVQLPVFHAMALSLIRGNE